ncbi:MAG: hypothetical protein UY35_C0018G0009 [Candidatus Saccharibacteria bacterium GW2011_GWC2_48_9]|nr:MAG: hypothetical protein UY35_C0018G0009 [Candidatus Saccharibacteria bacterium GW2011_GWC2_48_9]HCH34411.1 hypothetical protein [Candidatus Saccharibacteria bacterium]
MHELPKIDHHELGEMRSQAVFSLSPQAILIMLDILRRERVLDDSLHAQVAEWAMGEGDDVPAESLQRVANAIWQHNAMQPEKSRRAEKTWRATGHHAVKSSQ